ncbi:hypothetical protein U1Q18_008276 [Sarracenia purpurea var. burkii]
MVLPEVNGGCRTMVGGVDGTGARKMEARGCHNVVVGVGQGFEPSSGSQLPQARRENSGSLLLERKMKSPLFDAPSKKKKR